MRRGYHEHFALGPLGVLGCRSSSLYLILCSCTNTPNSDKGTWYQVPLPIPRLYIRKEANLGMLRRT